MLELSPLSSTCPPVSSTSPFFELIVAVQAEDIDRQNHVNNTVYLRWIQDVAVAHWRALASSEAQKKIQWVVLRHEIEYKKPAFRNDRAKLRTWVGKATRITFERFTEIRREADDQVLSTARTLWCPVDSETGRPVRVSSEIRGQFST